MGKPVTITGLPANQLTLYKVTLVLPAKAAACIKIEMSTTC
jgi:hypothetical protein